MNSICKALLVVSILSACKIEVAPEAEIYAYLTDSLEIEKKDTAAFILQNPGSPCGGCINTGNKIAAEYPAVPTITGLSRRRLINSRNCIIDTSESVFYLLPSSFISYVLVKENESLHFILLEQRNHDSIRRKFDELKIEKTHF